MTVGEPAEPDGEETIILDLERDLDQVLAGVADDLPSTVLQVKAAAMAAARAENTLVYVDRDDRTAHVRTRAQECDDIPIGTDAVRRWLSEANGEGVARVRRVREFDDLTDVHVNILA